MKKLTRLITTALATAALAGFAAAAFSTPSTANALSVDFDVHETTLLVGDGHSAYRVDIVDEVGNVVDSVL